MRTFHFIVGCTAAALIACGGHTDAKQGLEGPAVGGEEVSPQGDRGYDVGDVVPSVAFIGWEHLDPSTLIDTNADAIGSIRFYDFYDPDGTRGLTFLYVSLQWVQCRPSGVQEDFTNGANWTYSNPPQGNAPTANWALQYATRGVRFITLLASATGGWQNPASLMDLTKWTQQHEARVSEGIIAADELAIDVIANAAPYNMIIDVRTMRIVDISLGFDPTMAALEKLLK